MPVIRLSQYRPPPFLSNGHLQTIYANLVRKLNGVKYRRERLQTSDRDFLDLDWSTSSSNHLAILSHGLGGDAYRPYILGMVKALNRKGFDTLSWNARGCSGEPNQTPRMTHSGATEDLDAVIQLALSKGLHQRIVLIGFSLGGNITLKYLGERGRDLPPLLDKAVVFSVPSHLESTAWQLAKFSNALYMKRFLFQLRRYVRAKRRIPYQIDDRGFHRIKNFKQFDDRYVAPIHGFKDAEDYWRKSSADNVLENIRIPTLMVNAKNDPFLTSKCFPTRKAERNSHLFLEIPSSGGHVGFVSFNREGEYWSETRTLSFLTEK